MNTKEINENSIFNNHKFFNWAHWYIFLACIVFFIFTFSKPIQNWDILGYVASAISIENNNPDDIHNYVYEEYKKYASNEEFKSLTEGHSYRETMFKNAELFYQQIPFYKIRLIFIALILALAKLGVDIFIASHFITAALSSLSFLVFYYAFRKLIHPLFWIITPIFIVLFNIQEVARMVTADALALLWVSLITFAFIHEKWKLLSFLLISSVLVRTDLIFLVGLFAGYFLIFRPDLRVTSIAILLSSVGIYLMINNFADNYGWSTVFYYAIVSNMEATQPSEYGKLGITVGQYLYAVKNNIGIFFTNIPTLFFEITVLIQFYIFYYINREKLSFKKIFTKATEQPTLILTTISIIYLVIHYVLFPLKEPRFFSGQFLIGILSLLALISSLLTNEKTKE